MRVFSVILCFVLSGCLQSGDGDLDVLQSVAQDQNSQQEAYLAEQKKLLEAQTKRIKEEQAKQLALIEENRRRFLDSSGGAMSSKPKENAKSEIKVASVAGSARASGRITFNAPWKCVPDRLKKVIHEVSVRYGHVTVNSTYRSGRKNRRVGGARHSYHLHCQAVDFRVKGSSSAVLRFLRNNPNVGGVKRYRTGYFHIDTGPRRSW